MSSGVSAFRLNRRRSRSGGMRLTRTAATWPHACTPASVRPAPRTRTGSRSTVESARSSTSCTVGPPAWTCQPWYAVPSYSTVSRSCTSEVIARQDLGDLYRGERRALAHVVERDPQREPRRIGRRIVADAADVRRVRASHLGRRRVGSARVVVQQDARRLAQDGSGRGGREWRLRLDVHAERGAEEDGHADRRHADREPRQVEQPPQLLDGEQLVRRRAARLERAHLRHAIERDPAGKAPPPPNPARAQQVHGLARERADRAPARARHPLIRRDDDAPEARLHSERREHDRERDRRGARAGDDPALAPVVELRDVHLRDDERHLAVQAEAAAHVDHGGARRRGAGRVLAGDARPRREERQLDAVEGLLGQERDLPRAPRYFDLGACGSMRAEQTDRAYGQLSLREQLEDLAADEALRTDDGDGELRPHPREPAEVAG